MKAILSEDVIVSASRTGTEIGAIPRGIGLERLRWDGSQIIDLGILSSIWVRRRAGVWSLHCREVPGSQLVAMTYADRRRLVEEGGIYRLLTPAEVEAKAAAAAQELADASSSRSALASFIGSLTYDKVGDHIDQVFGGLTAAQKTSLKLLYRIVLWLAKRAA